MGKRRVEKKEELEYCKWRRKKTQVRWSNERKEERERVRGER